ncbi:NEK protein kinase [Pelomyxa schiedti]|nr:NEK protein kinase [Pelomyxa schiedti]
MQPGMQGARHPEQPVGPVSGIGAVGMGAAVRHPIIPTNIVGEQPHQHQYIVNANNNINYQHHNAIINNNAHPGIGVNQPPPGQYHHPQYQIQSHNPGVIVSGQNYINGFGVDVLSHKATKTPSTFTDFKILLFLGKGTYGSVTKVMRLTTGKIYALKEVDMRNKKQVEREEAVNEIRLLASVKHPHIIRYRDSFFENEKLYIVTDFAEKGDLSKYLNSLEKQGLRLPENDVWSVFLQVCLALGYMHNNRILHRDLKTSNIFMCDNMIVKLGDLGVAKLLKSALTTTQVGTPYYISPEIWRKMPYNSKSDMWSLGCVLYEMMTFQHPFNASSPKELSDKILRGRYPPIYGYSRDLTLFVELLLNVNANARPSAKQILGMPNCIQKMSQIFGNTSISCDLPTEIVNTIRVPKNLSRLTENLPVPSL